MIASAASENPDSVSQRRLAPLPTPHLGRDERGKSPRHTRLSCTDMAVAIGLHHVYVAGRF